MNYSVSLLYFVPGLIAIALIDTLGAIASRRFNFRFGYLSVLSVAVYIALAFLVSRKAGLESAAVVNCVLGLLDSTVGLFLSIKLRANTRLSIEQHTKLLNANTALIMIFFAFLLSVAGYGLTFL